MKSKIFSKIFLSYVVIAVTAGLFTEFYIASTARANHIRNLKEHLSDKITLIAGSIHFNKTDLDDLCRGLKNDIHARVTIIRDDGRVIGDSDHDSSQMDNHADRPEIQRARHLSSGTAVRFSDTLKYDFFYLARRVTGENGDAGFIRLAVPLKDIDNAISHLRFRIVLAMLLVLLVTGGLAVWQTERLRRLLKQITDFSRSLSRGDIDRKLFLKGAGEFTEIADNLTSMSHKLKGIMTQSEEEKTRLNVILKSVPDALLIINAHGTVTLSSSSVRDFFGGIPTTGVHFIEVVRNHQFSDLIEEVKKSLSPGMSEFTVETPAEKHMTVRVSPLFYKERELSGFVAVFHDITEIKKLEQVRKDFVANVSHELKTPITAIKGFADTLIDGALDDKDDAVRFVKTIKSNSERINALVDDLMTISKVELGVIKVEKTLLDIQTVFESIIELFKDRAVAKKLFLRTDINPDIRQIEADRNRLIQILTNLIDNALKFTETGGVIFGIKRENGKNILFVEDTGLGVPEKYVSRLGERFFRVDPARSRKMGGTGLGLAIVKHLVKAHGWSMQFESRQGEGTKVRINL
jgi:two-component system phosphate regulon sensor histidine kinase PhoR